VSSSSFRRDYDSTGLRAAPQLITPLLRCASLVKHTCILRASEATQQISKKGSRQAPLLLFGEAFKAAEALVTVPARFFRSFSTITFHIETMLIVRIQSRLARR
jgi:hypothetical protein